MKRIIPLLFAVTAILAIWFAKYRQRYYEIVPGEGIRGVCLLRSFPTDSIQLPRGKRTPQKYLPCASPTFPSVSFALDPEKGVCPIEIAVDHNVAIKNRRLWMTKRRDPHLKNITADDIIELFGPVPAVTSLCNLETGRIHERFSIQLEESKCVFEYVDLGIVFAFESNMLYSVAVQFSHRRRQAPWELYVLAPYTLDFGPVSETSRPSLTATLTNNGDAPVNITDIVRTCVCADMAVSPTNIPPGGTATITTTLDPNVFSGPFLKTFYLRTDDPDAPSIAVPLRGTVVPLWTVEPSKWMQLRPGETNAAFRIHPATNAPPLVRAEAVGAPGATVSLVPLPDGDWEAMLAFDPAALAPGHHDWTLNLHPEDPALRPLSLHVGASVGARWTCSPSRLLAPSDGSSCAVDLLLRPADMAAVPTDIDPAAIVLSPSWDRVSIAPAGPATARGIPLRLFVDGNQLRSWQSPKVFHLTIPGHGTASVYLETALSATPQTSRETSFPPNPPKEGSVPPSDRIATAIGADPATRSLYAVRHREVSALPNDLIPAETAALVAYLRLRDDSLHPDRVAALKNEVWNTLRRQQTPVPALVVATIGTFRDAAQPAAVRDYAVQHLGALLKSGTLSAADKEQTVACLREAASTPSATYAGTALIALSQDTAPSSEEAVFLRERIAAIAADPTVCAPARISAFQLAAEQGVANALPAARSVVRDSSAPVPLRLAAIAALRRRGDDTDRSFLDDLSRTNANPRLAPALRP